MNKVKKRTQIDKFRDAYRAYRGKQIGSVTFGVDVKKCNECDYKRRSDVLYICDQRACQNCSYPMCGYTTDIRHAKNFVYSDGFFKEIEHETGESV